MMEPKLGTGAPSGVQDWHDIDWSEQYRNVRRLQTRIVKATKEGRWGKVKALQWLLTHSFGGRAISVKRVTENRGRKTSGVDHVLWSTPEAKRDAIDTLKRCGYRPSPLRRIYIPKANGKLRPLGIPTMKDRAMQALHLLALEPISETRGDTHSYGFRQQRSTADAIEHCHLLLARPDAPQWILEGDIRGCFDEIAHEWLIAHVPMDKAMLRKWLSAGYMEGGRLFPTEAGTPQGGSISPALANWALDGLQDQLAQHCSQRFYVNGRRTRPKVNLVRYADDFVITGYSKELLESEVMPLVAAFLRERGLELSPDKTRITPTTDGFDFLGQNVRRYKTCVLTKPAKKNVKAYLTKVRELIKRNAAIDQLSLIRLLNPIIRGWANYHRHAAAKHVMYQADHNVWQALWRWCCRRHPNKGRRWVKQRYFHHVGPRSWVFMAVTGELTESGKPKWLSLYKASDTPIRRHIKIKAEANPFDPAWDDYFELRANRKRGVHIDQYKKPVRLWIDQQGLCPVCRQQIDEDTGWFIHRVPTGAIGNMGNAFKEVVLHPSCQAQVRRLSETVTKPAPSGGLERLEPYAGELARTVLRGGGDGNVTSLPDLKSKVAV